MAGFTYVKNRLGGNDIPRNVQIAASATVAVGDLLKFSNGKATRCSAQNDLPVLLCVGCENGATSVTSTSTSITKVKCVDVLPSQVFEVTITPILNDATVVSATTTSVTVAQTAGTNNDMIGGLVYVNGQQRIITGNTYSGGNNAISFVEALSAAPAVGDLVRAVAYGYGTTALKLDGTNFQSALSNAIADITGGKVTVIDVDLSKKLARVAFA